MPTERQTKLIRSWKGLSGEEASDRISAGDEQGKPIGYLAPITKHNADDERIACLLSLWRERHKQFFLSQVSFSPKGTRQWLTDIVLPDDARLLFIAHAGSGVPVGTAGVANITEEDGELANVLRGEPGGHPRLFRFASIALLDWCFNTLFLERMYLKVFSDNARAIHLYDSIGFTRTSLQALIKRKSDEGIVYDVDSSRQPAIGDVGLLTMSITKSQLVARYPWLVVMDTPISR